MANWLNPVTDFINAMKSGASAGEAIARIKSDNSQAAAKLNQAAQAESDQNSLGYAKLASEERQSQQSAVEKLQQAMAQQSALNAYRNRSLDQKSDAADELTDYRNRSLDQKSSSQASLDQFRNSRLAQHQGYLDYIGGKMSDVDRLDYSNALSTQLAANKALATSFDDTQKAAATSQWGQADATIQRIKSKYAVADTSNAKDTPAGGTVTPSAADSLTPAANPSENYGLFAPASSTSNTDTTSAADALTSGTSRTLPAQSDSATVTTQEDFDALPSGTVYTGRDGKKYRKP